MKRLAVALLALALLAAPLAAQVQQPGKVSRIGVLRPGSPADPFVEVFRQGLRELGWAESQSIAIGVCLPRPRSGEQVTVEQAVRVRHAEEWTPRGQSLKSGRLLFEGGDAWCTRSAGGSPQPRRSSRRTNLR